MAGEVDEEGPEPFPAEPIPGQPRRWALRGALVAALLILALVAIPSSPGPMLLVASTVLTMDGENRVVEAVAVEGGRIAAVGSRRDLEAWAESRDADVVELGARALLPGFVDGHSHFPATGILAPFVHVGSPPLGEVVGIDDLVAKLAAEGPGSRQGQWVVGWGYDDTLLAEGRHPTRADLDRVSTEHPVVVFHISMHVAAVNSKGLAALGYSGDSADPEGGRLRRDEAGNLDGVLEEEAMRPALLAALMPSTFRGLLATRRAAREYLAAGVTTAQTGAAPLEQLLGLVRLSRLGLLPLRLVLWPEGDTALALLEVADPARDADADWIRVGASKFIADGSIQAYTAFLREPYAVLPEGAEADWRGAMRIAPEELLDSVTRVHAAGRQVAVHGNGDGAIDLILDAIESAQAAHPRDDARHVIVHAQTARDDQLDRMKVLGVVPSFFELHTYYWGDRHRDRFLGPERAARISPLRGAQERGLRFTLHTDAPVVPMEPLRALDAAVTRRTASGEVLGEEQRIDVVSALRALTIDAAWQMFVDDRVGSIEPGKLADFVVLDRSPLEEGQALANLRVVETFVGGRSVFRSKDY